MSLPVAAIAEGANLYPKPHNIQFQYGTAGFRMPYVMRYIMGVYCLRFGIKQRFSTPFSPIQGWHSGCFEKQETGWENGWSDDYSVS